MKKKIVLISGSPRKGNTDYILSNLYNLISCDKEIIYIRKKNIKHCKGCLNCYKNLPCSIKDDMAEVAEIIERETGETVMLNSIRSILHRLGMKSSDHKNARRKRLIMQAREKRENN